MPRVPTYSRQVTTEEMPNVRVQSSADASSFGGGVAKELGQFGDVLEKRASQMQDEDDRNAVIGAKSSFDSQLTSTLFDENKGLLTRRGKDALNITSEFSKDYDARLKEASKGLVTQRQQTALNQYALSQKDNYLRTVSSHQAKERQSYTEENGKVAFNAAINLAIPNPNDENINKNSIDTIKITAKSMHGHLGEDVVNSKIAEGVSSLRIGQINNMVSQGQGITARDFAVAHKDEIDPQKYDIVFAKAESKAISQESAAVADDVFGRYGLTDERGAMKYLKDTYGTNPGYDKFSNVVQARYVDERRFDSEEKRQYKLDLSQRINSSGSLGEAEDHIDGSDLSDGEKQQVRRKTRQKHNTLANNPTDEQFFWSKYETSGLYSDIKKLEEYKTRIANGEKIPEEDQVEYNNAAYMKNKYNDFSYGRGYAPANGWNREANGDSNNSTQQPSQEQAAVGELINKARMNGASPEAIKQALRDKGYNDMYDSWVW